MNNYMSFIIFVMSVVAIAVVVAIVRKVSKRMESRYDERQRAIRGAGFKYGFTVIVLLNLIYGLFLYELMKEFINYQEATIAIVFIGCAVTEVYCIFNDAYVQVGQKIKSWIMLCIIVIVANVFAAIGNYELVKEGEKDGFSLFLNVAVSLLFAVILGSVAAKCLMNRRSDKYEES
ncbi:hypothetical protein [Eubacterium oxidoreducens]|uniref:Uncharacterized protein n=1 Tax=Eubacterium oxidoreducens TaxID=1732 RepID=A0A1G6CSM0_EUBOX|nr:hypothetical protein [Eubacterium oxidoreducens]SDB35868.1 hypothetical protein SAMN02910417_02645 [Eubacterium oxidoreducens]